MFLCFQEKSEFKREGSWRARQDWVMLSLEPAGWLAPMFAARLLPFPEDDGGKLSGKHRLELKQH